jgi:hypothetical protein
MSHWFERRDKRKRKKNVEINWKIWDNLFSRQTLVLQVYWVHNSQIILNCLQLKITSLKILLALFWIINTISFFINENK